MSGSVPERAGQEPEGAGQGRGNAGPGVTQEAVSFFRLEGGHALLETCKPAFDRRGGVVLRVYETKGCGGETTLLVPGSVRRVYACNMLEEVQQELELEEGKVRLGFHAFEIKTVLLELSGP